MELTAKMDDLRRVHIQDRYTEEDVTDERDRSKPSEWVQRKLLSCLPGSHIPVSCLHAGRSVRR